MHSASWSLHLNTGVMALMLDLIFILSMSQCIHYDWSIWWDIFTVQPAKFKSLFWSPDCNLEI